MHPRRLRHPWMALLLFCLLSCTAEAQAASQPSVWSAQKYEKIDVQAFLRLTEITRRIDFTRVDGELLNAAVFYETNARRMEAGLSPLAHSQALERAAAAHAGEMVLLQYFSHESPTEGRRTMAERMLAVGVSGGYRGENIAKGFGLDYADGRPVFPPAQTGGGFRYALDGPDLASHTYAGAARALVDQWMKSPPHRANILNPKFTFLGCAVIPYKAQDLYGMDFLMAVQELASLPGPMEN